MTTTIFPTPVEFIRSVARSLDTKASVNKELDDAAKNVHLDYRYISKLWNDAVVSRVALYVGEEAAALLHTLGLKFIERYKSLIASNNVDGLNREDIYPPLLGEWGASHFFPVLDAFLDSLEDIGLTISVQQLVNSEARAVNVVLNQLQVDSSVWKKASVNYSKEVKDRISEWRRGDSLPSIQGISNLLSNDDIAYRKIKSLILKARCIDSLRREKFGAILIDGLRFLSNGGVITTDFEQSKSKIMNEKGDVGVAEITRLFDVHRQLVPSYSKIGLNHNSILNEIHLLREAIKVNKDIRGLLYRIDWLQARYLVATGELIHANNCYKKAVNGALFQSGPLLSLILEEALVVASSLTKNNKLSIDKTFLKKLKNIQISFELEIPSVSNSGEQGASNKFEEFVQDWEVVHWRSCLYDIFPITSFFDGVMLPALIDCRRGSLNVRDDLNKTPDLRKPDRIIRVGKNKEKRIPQLVWFIQSENKESVLKILKLNPSMNVQSDVGETPIMMALENLLVEEIPYRSMDSEYFTLISSLPHDVETVNRVTQKKKILPLIQGVQSGMPWVVKKLLELGARANQRGLVDNQTALNICIKYMGIVKNPDKWVQRQLAHPLNDELLDGFRRYSNGALGMNLNDQVGFMHNPIYKKFINRFLELTAQRIATLIQYDDLLEILNLLLKYDADCNATFNSPLPGYTSLMLAAELNLESVFRILLDNGGDPKKTFFHPEMNHNADCWDIARYWKADHILKIKEEYVVAV